MRNKLLVFGQFVAIFALVACGQKDDGQGQAEALVDAGQASFAPDASSAEGGALDAAHVSNPVSESGAASPREDAAADVGPREDARSGALDANAEAATSVADAAGGSADAAASDSPCPTNGDPCKVLPLGDSITFGLGYEGGYRVELFRKARVDKKRITFLGSLQNGPAMVNGESFPKNNEGHSGWIIDQIAGLVPSPALADKPHIVLLMAGTNDVNFGTDLPNAPKRLGALIDKISAASPAAWIVVAQITPLTQSGQGATSPVTIFNAALPELVTTRANAGKHVVLVDMNKSFPAGALGDGIHPNQMGYEWMAGVWYQAIGPLLR